MPSCEQQPFVLIVEDDPQVRSLIGRILTRDGHDVSAVGSVLEARAAFKAKTPDIVLLDLGLPGAGGLDLGRWIRASYPAVGIIIVTGRAEVNDRITGPVPTIMSPSHSILMNCWRGFAACCEELLAGSRPGSPPRMSRGSEFGPSTRINARWWLAIGASN